MPQKLGSTLRENVCAFCDKHVLGKVGRMKQILKELFGCQYSNLFLFLEFVPIVYNKDIFKHSLYSKSLKHHFYSFEKQIIDFKN